MYVELLPPGGLGPELRERWLALLRDAPHLRTPYLHPDFFIEVGRVRPAARVAVVRDAKHGSVECFMPLEIHGRKGTPLARRLSDYQGWVRREGWTCDPRELVRALDLTTLEFDHWIESDSEMGPHTWMLDGSPIMDMRGGWEAYNRRRLRSKSSELSAARRKARKLEREIGPLRFEFLVNSDDGRVFQQLLAWKSAQYRRTQGTNVFSYDWPVALMRSLLARRDPEFQGVLSALYAGERLVAAHLGMRQSELLHYWFPAYDVELRRFSPGLALLLRLVGEADHQGVFTLDLGRGMARYKSALMTSQRDVRVGAVELRPLAHNVRRSLRTAKAWIKQSSLAKPAKLPGKMLYRLRGWMAFRT
jgi:CelD/BcsL family acetyltransferase involved in cellulose biosynthesis